MKESTLGLLNKLIAVPEAALDTVIDLLKDAKKSIGYLVLVVLLLDVYTGGTLVATVTKTGLGLLQAISGNLIACAVLVVAWAIKNK